MKVYVAQINYSNEGIDILRIFSSFADAEKYLKKEEEKSTGWKYVEKVNYADDCYFIESFDVE